MARDGRSWPVRPVRHLAADRESGGDGTGRRPDQRRAEQPGARGLAPGAVVTDAPALGPRMVAQAAVGVDHHRVTDQVQHRRVVVGVGVRRTPAQVEALPLGERGDRGRLGGSVEHLTHEPAGVDPVDLLGDGAEGPGQAQPPRDDPGDLDRRRRDQPDPLALVEVQLRERPGAGPDPVRHGLVEDLLAELLELADPVPLDERERRRACLGDVLGILDPREPEVGLLPGRAQDVPGGEEPSPVQTPGEVEDRRPLHDRVVDVEERSRRRVRRGGQRRLHLRDRGGRLTGEGRAAPEVGWRAARGTALSRLGRSAGAAPMSTHGGHPSALRRAPDRVRPCARLAPVTVHVADLLSRAAAEAGDRVALAEPGSGRRVTWAELDSEADRVARGLNAMGLVAGYRVVITMVNRTELVTTYLGALRAGLVAVPVNPRSATGELVRLLTDCGARVVVADTATLTTVRQAVAGLQDALAAADE